MPKHVFTKISIWFTATFMRFHSMWRCIIEGLHFCICLVAWHSIVKVLMVQAAAWIYIFCNTCNLYRKIVQQSGWHVKRCSTKVYEADGRESGTCTLQIFGQPKLWEEYAEIGKMLHKGPRYSIWARNLRSNLKTPICLCETPVQTVQLRWHLCDTNLKLSPL